MDSGDVMESIKLKNGSEIQMPSDGNKLRSYGLDAIVIEMSAEVKDLNDVEESLEYAIERIGKHE
jgi:hypothetical protein